MSTFRTRRPREVMVVSRTHRRQDPRTIKDILLMTGGSRTMDIEDNPETASSPSCLTRTFPFLNPCHLSSPIIFVMHFPSILPNPLLYLNISSSLVHSQFSLSQDKINSFELLNYKSAGLGGVTLISFSFVYCHSWYKEECPLFQWFLWLIGKLFLWFCTRCMSSCQQLSTFKWVFYLDEN